MSLALADGFLTTSNTWEATKGLRVTLLVTQSRPRLYSLPGSSAYGILQTRVLEWAVISFSRGSFWSKIEPGSPTLQADSLRGKYKYTQEWYAAFLEEGTKLLLTCTVSDALWKISPVPMFSVILSWDSTLFFNQYPLTCRRYYFVFAFHIFVVLLYDWSCYLYP